MKRILLLVSACMMMSVFSANAFDIKSALKNAAGAAAQSSNQSGSGIGDIISGVTNLLGITDVTIADLEGTWTYVKPAIAFQSDNLLQKAGGTAAATVIENKLEPYYKKTGITAMSLTVNADSTFTMGVNKIQLKGKLEKNSDGNFVFNFQAFGKVKIGQFTSVITKSGNNIDVTFDASKLLALVTKIASISGNSTLGTLSSLLNSYDGMNAGFQLAKQK